MTRDDTAALRGCLCILGNDPAIARTAVTTCSVHGDWAVREMKPKMTVQKAVGYIAVSNALLADNALDLNEFLNPSMRTRLRLKIRRWRDRMAIWLYRRVAGHDLPEPLEEGPDDWE